MSEKLDPPTWIAQPGPLSRLVDDLSRQSIIGVDTESNSLFAYQEQVCLIQFSTEQEDVLVDPLAIKNLSNLGPVFANPSIEKVFHAAEYDLICLKRDFGFTFTNLFDTMLAARVLGRTGLGLGTMLESEFGIVVDKRYQRANWARRPIPADMLKYARMDTHFLIPLRHILHEQLVKSGRLPLAEEDFRRMTRVPAGISLNGNGAAAIDTTASPGIGSANISPVGANTAGIVAACWRIPGAQDLTPRQAAVLMSLCNFREERARAMNQPPFRVLPNQTLIEIAQIMPRKRGELANIFGLSQKLIDRYAAGLLEAVERGVVGPPAYRPPYQRLNDAVLWRLDTLRTWRKVTAREMGVESDVILPRDILEVIAHQNPRSMEELSGVMADFPWRLDHFGQRILEALRH